ncbi:MAG: TIGR00299 family protein [Firmicutes bacterium HGW-Firmicutes-7]|nr:MAG: TIGR00299 family protein [Firmicutes bacterium HGW-Firmicutes-7]
MKLLYFNCFAGISGDMTLGALVDLGVDPEFLIRELKKLPIANEFDLKIYKAQKMGITGTKVDVIIHENEHAVKHHDHMHNEPSQFEHVHNCSHEHRNLSMIQSIINESTLSIDVKALSMKIFMEVARAEAKVHNKPLDEVHFHEVGAVDSIVDIVGTAICIHALDVNKIMSSTVELGGGFVKCAHGLIPVPAPATAEILKDVPVHLGRVNSETTTPTGAAILKAIVEAYDDKMAFSIVKIGCGLGTKDFTIPNLLRVFLAETQDQEDDRQIIVETNIDDMNPEFYNYIENLLFEVGARDVYKTNIIMKKGRPAVMLSILVEQSKLNAVKTIIFRETTSLGLRTYPIEKTELIRKFEKVMTPYGYITVKKGFFNDCLVSSKFEYEECALIAKKFNIPIKKLYSELNVLLEQEV